MKIIRACEYGNDTGLKISRIFAESFYQWLKFFSKNKEKLSMAFSHMFNPDVFYIAVEEGGEIAGIAACTVPNALSVRPNRSELRKHLGFFMGTVAYAVLKREFEKQYPFEIENGMGFIELVATAEKFRGRGVATAVLGGIFKATPYNDYVLEVADTNTNARKLYQKMGFTEFLRIRHKYAKQSGINCFIYMKYQKRNGG